MHLIEKIILHQGSLSVHVNKLWKFSQIFLVGFIQWSFYSNCYDILTLIEDTLEIELDEPLSVEILHVYQLLKYRE
jgi:hypothetical protein